MGVFFLILWLISSPLIHPDRPPVLLESVWLEYEMQQVRSLHGETDTFVDRIIQTPEGHIWFPTQSMMLRYDGLHVRPISTKMDSVTGLAFIRGVFDYSGHLWMGQFPGFSIYRIENEIPRKVREPLVEGRFMPVFFRDPLNPNGMLVTATDSTTMYAISKDGDVQVMLRHDILNTINIFSDIRGATQDEIWAHTFRGQILRMIRHPKEVTLEIFDDFGRISDIAWHPDQVLIAATSRGVWALKRNKNGEMTRELLFSHANIRSLTITTDGRIHMIAPGEYFIYDGHSVVSASLGNASYLKIRADREDNLWLVGRSGIDLITRKKNPVLSGEHPLGESIVPVPGTGGAMYLVYADRIVRADIHENTVTTVVPVLQEITTSEIYQGFVDGKNRLWLQTQVGLVALDRNQNYRRIADLRSGGIIQFYIQDDGTPLFVDRFEGLLAYDEQNQRLQKIQELENSCVYSYRFSSGNLFCMDLFLELPEVIYADQQRSDSLLVPAELQNSRVRYFAYHEPTHSGIIVLSSGFWALFHEETGFQVISPEQLPEFGTLRDIAWVGDELWLGSDMGANFIARAQFEALESQKKIPLAQDWITNSDGLPSFIFDQWNTTFVSDVRHRVWIATPRGILIYARENTKTVPPPPGLWLNSITHGTVRTPVYEQGKLLTVRAKERDLSFDISVLSFLNRSQIQLEYKLQGLHTNWQDAVLDQPLRFTNVPPGEYRLIVRALSARNVATEEVVLAHLRIPSLFYETVWFRWALMFLFGALIFLISRGRAVVAERRARKLEHVVEERTREIKKQKEEVEKANKIIQKQTEDLVQQDELKNKLFTNISHELRTPVTLIKAPLEHLLLHEKGETISASRSNMERTFKNALRLEKLVDQLLDVTRIDRQTISVRMIPVNIVKEVRWLIESFRSYAEFKEIRLHFTSSHEALFVALDKDMFEKICMNLLSNAVKFTPRGGQIKVELSTEQTNVNVKITDSGVGISSKDMPRIFERYYKVTQKNGYNSEGMGIGLSLTKEFVEIMKGNIGVESSPGKGACFTLQFPLLPATSETKETAGRQPEILKKTKTRLEKTESNPLETPRTTILIVDDNEDMVAFTSELLSETYRVFTASDGEQAIRHMTEETPDLIITDLLMPNLDGIEMVKRIRSRSEWRTIPILMLTAIKSEDVLADGFSYGINDYMTKPFSTIELQARVAALIHFADTRKAFGGEETEPSTQSSSDLLVQKTIGFIQQHIADTDLKAADVARAVTMSDKQLNRKLKKVTGMTTSEFIREVRLQKAREILEDKSKETIAEVMYEIGFLHQTNFSKRYYERFGKKPSDYF